MNTKSSRRRQDVEKKDSERGASSVSRSMSARLKSYAAHHKEALNATFLRVSDDKVQTFLTALVVAIALSLPALLLVGLKNIQALGEQWDTEPKITLYLHARAKRDAISGFERELAADVRVASFRYIDADQALAEFETFAGFGDALKGLSHNPLPSSIEITVVPSHQGTAQQAQLAEEWQKHALVEEASVDLAWVQRFLAITQFLSQAVWMLALLLAIGAILAIGNTIRLIIESRKDEIIITKLVGGTDAFVKRPLIYTGALYGLSGALVAAILVWLVLAFSSAAVAAVAESYGSSFSLRGLSPQQTLQLLVAGTLIGWLGALLATNRHIRKIEPV